MSEKKLNKEQIQEYLKKLHKGTLTGEEQWLLERESLDDPFLEETLEGYYDNKEDHTATLQALHNKISAKESKPKSRILGRRWLSMAAAVALLLTASFWLYDSMGSPHIDKVMASKSESVQVLKENADLLAQKSTSIADKLSADKDINRAAVSTTESIKKNKPRPQTEKTTLATAESKPQTPTSPIATPTPPIAARVVEETAPAKLDSEVADQNLKDNEIFEVIEEEEEEVVASNAFKIVSKKKATKEESRRYAEDDLLKDEIRHNYYPSDRAYAKTDTVQNLESRLVLLDHNGTALPGVQILDQYKNQLGSSDINGVFNLPSNLPYVTTAFAGYDSLTVATAPNLSVQLQSTSELLRQPHLRLVDMMDDGELIRHYSNKLNSLFAKEWPLCPANRESRLGYFTTTSVYLVITEQGTVDEIRFFREIDESCQSKITDVIEVATIKGIFEIGRPVSFTFRINL